MLPEFVQRRVGGAMIRVHPAFADAAFVERLADADGFFRDPGCEIVKDQKKIKVGRLAVQVAGARRALYVKRYNAFSLRYKIGSPFALSGARRALRGAAILGAAKIATATPVAAVEHRSAGILQKSFFISEEIAGGATADRYWRETLRPIPGRAGFRRRRGFLGALAGLFRALHEQNIYHDDLKDANILAVGGAAVESFFLLDLEGVRRCARLSARRRIKNLVQLERTFGRGLGRSERLAFLKCYLGASFAERRFRRRTIAAVLAAAGRVDRAKARAARGESGSAPSRI